MEPGAHSPEAAVRMAFLNSASGLTPLLGDEAVERRWNEPSVLDRWTVGDLVSHLTRAVLTVGAYLDRPPPEDGTEPLDASEYLIGVDGLSGADGPDLDSELHRAILERARRQAQGGREAVLAEWRGGLADLEARLPAEAGNRRLAVLGGRVMLLDRYLVTRLVEMAVHGDDLATSIGVATPPPDPEALTLVIEALLAAARLRHGDLAVIRAMTRTERDTVRALRVL